MITIGNVFHGPELPGSVIYNVLTKVAKTIQVSRGDFQLGLDPAVNVVFVVPGSMGCPDWEETREGKYSSAKKLLLVEVAVPDKVAQSEDPSGFIVEMLHAANCIAFHFYDEKGMTFALLEAEALVRKVAESLRMADAPPNQTE